ncbi:hypothetical protein CEXT_177771 [Caerostris extrusa]|uniref:Uncharacterized protein n=1 Tax=Caerostris extrusa TaxID=172846 RepID=A0AAV4TCV7_CAEEX|nr:hypothetical protein CEXT_177771 [Caerostris extrusa]
MEGAVISSDLNSIKQQPFYQDSPTDAPSPPPRSLGKLEQSLRAVFGFRFPFSSNLALGTSFDSIEISVAIILDGGGTWPVSNHLSETGIRVRAQNVCVC